MSEQMQVEQSANDTTLRNKINIFLWVIVLFLLFTNSVSMIYLFYSLKKTSNKPVIAPQHQQKQAKTIVPVRASSTKDNKVEKVATTDIDDTMSDSQGKDWFGTKVSWLDWPVKENVWNVFEYKYVQNFCQKNKDEIATTLNYNQEKCIQDIYSHMTVEKLGQIDEGEYQGDKIYRILFHEDGPSWRDTMFRFIGDGDDFVLLSNYSDDPQYILFYQKLFIKQIDIRLAGLEAPEQIDAPNSSVHLLRSSGKPLEKLADFSQSKFLFQDNDWRIYLDKAGGCFLATLADDTAWKYYLALPFVVHKEVEDVLPSTPRVLQVTWLDNTKNIQDYNFRVMNGYGIGGDCYSYADYIVDLSQLKLAGTTIDGEKMYELKDTSIKSDSKSNKSVLRTIYDSIYYGGNDTKISYDEFLQDHPLIFWQDPFGNFMEFRNAKYQPMVEMGKPVIYLYPEQEIDAQVYVEPSGGLTLTEPIYHNGWKVKAQPNGKLYNYADNKFYPYLFWEGYSTDYQRPEQGFVVAREDVREFLIDKLSRLGLVQKEYDEFIEFWLPRMQGKPYYFVTFMEQSEFDKIAPLSVFPEPDQVIRIFMDYEGLDQYLEVEEPEIRTPERFGFTVVEWGGALHK